MCCIIYRKKGTKVLEDKNLDEIIKLNPDGWGYAYYDGRKVISDKHLDMTLAKNKFRELEEMDIEFLFHVRTASAITQNGVITTDEKLVVKTLDNCHPFSIFKTMMFHNGTMKIDIWDKTKSDSWHFAKKLTSAIGKGKSLKFLLEKYSDVIGVSRLAFINKYGEIRTKGNFTEYEGNFFSKMNWRTYGNYSSHYYNVYNVKTYDKPTNTNYKPKENYDVRKITSLPFKQVFDMCISAPEKIVGYIRYKLQGGQ